MRYILIAAIFTNAFFCARLSQAEGMIDVNPYVSGSVMHDTNLFRLSSKAEARAAGINRQSDTVKRIDVGVDASLRLSRQLIRLSANINDNRFSEYQFLDNVGRSVKLGWNWRLGSYLYGELSKSNSQSIASFTDNDNISKNTRTLDRHHASINWLFSPDWSVYTSFDNVKFSNDLPIFQNLDSEDDVYELGLRYQNTLATELGLFYRLTDTDFVNRTPTALVFFGKATEQKQYGVNAAWMVTPATRLSAQLSWIDIARVGAPQRDFDGFNQRWSIEHTLSGLTSLSASAFREVNPIDDILSTYAESKGANAGITWNLSPKLAVTSGISYYERAFLGTSVAVINAVDREDNTKRVSFSILYAPITDAQIQVAYSAEQRDANIRVFDYRFQTINFLARYNF